MKGLTDECWRDLADAIVLNAVEDWHRSRFQMSVPSLTSQRAHDLSKECERFFRSSWFETLTGLDGRSFLARVRHEYNCR